MTNDDSPVVPIGRAVLGLRPRSFTVDPADADELAWHRAMWDQYRIVADEQASSVAAVAFLGMASILVAKCEGDDELVRTIGGALAAALGRPVPAVEKIDDLAFYKGLARHTLDFVLAERPTSAA